MAEYSKVEVLDKVQKGESLERSDLSQIELESVTLDKVNLARADLESANLNGASLKKANLSSASLREAYFVGVNLENANLRNADLEGCNLTKANLRGADLSRANLEGANLEEADLTNARLQNAILIDANIGKGVMEKANLKNSDLQSAYLGGVNLIGCDLRKASLEDANLEEADLSSAQAKEANFSTANLEGAKLVAAGLMGCDFSESNLSNADVSDGDVRKANFSGTMLDNAIFTGAKLSNTQVDDGGFDNVIAEWIDGSTKGDGSQRISGDDIAVFLGQKMVAAAPSLEPGKRYFGKGDILRNADLEFDTGSVVEIESKFEKCKIVLGENAQLTVGQEGTLENCQIEGAGVISISGKITNNQKTHILYPKIFRVTRTGKVLSIIKQSQEFTRFAFEPGCTLKMKIMVKK